jgi:hypothetical protein
METTTVYLEVQKKQRWIPTSDFHLEEAEKLVFTFWLMQSFISFTESQQ